VSTEELRAKLELMNSTELTRLAASAGVTYPWILKVRSGEIKEPGHDKAEAIIEALKDME